MITHSPKFQQALERSAKDLMERVVGSELDSLRSAVDSCSKAQRETNAKLDKLVDVSSGDVAGAGAGVGRGGVGMEELGAVSPIGHHGGKAKLASKARAVSLEWRGRGVWSVVVCGV